jgi:hypothetical protein
VSRLVGSEMCIRDRAKSPNGFKVGFARVTTTYRLANTEGPTSADLFTLTFDKRPKPLFPFEK